MKPLNLDNSPCTPISSNCVIWQGPSIPCIKLCTGDTVSDVVFKLATELCTIMDTLNISNYDLACLNLPCSPDDYQALIQVLINKICELENIPVPPPSPDNGGCPDCIVELAPCFIAPGPNSPTTDNLVNYVKTIADKICDILDEITVIENDIIDIKGPGYITSTTLSSLQNQVNNLISSTFTWPDVAVPNGCTITGCAPFGPFSGPVNVPLDQLFKGFICDWCGFLGVTGTVSAISSAVLSQCIAGADIALKVQYSATGPASLMSGAYPSWINSPATIADAIKNIWISICDVRDAGKKLYSVTAGTNVTVSTAVTPTPGPADQTTTFTVNAELPDILDGNTTPATLLTANPTSIEFVGDLVNSTVALDAVTVNISSLGGFLAQTQTPNINFVSFNLLNTLASQPVINIPTTVYDDNSEYAANVFTPVVAGRYNIHAFISLTETTDFVNGWFNLVDATPVVTGVTPLPNPYVDPTGPNPYPWPVVIAPIPSIKQAMFGIGVFNNVGNIPICVNYVSITGPQKQILISAQATGIPLTTTDSLSLKVINQTGKNYTSTAGDVVRFSVQRIK